MKQQLVALIPQTAFRVPGVTKHISKALSSLDGAIAETQKALETSSAIGATPIGLSVAKQAGGQPPSPSPFM